MAGIRWSVLAIGHMSANPYFGEPERGQLREPACTVSLVRTPNGIILVDAGPRRDEMALILERRAGLRFDDVDAVYTTHFHSDHIWGVPAFEKATWYMAQAELDAWRERVGPDHAYRSTFERMTPAPQEFSPGVTLLPAPGHTRGLTALLVEDGRHRVVIASDSVPTEDHFRDRKPLYNAEDMEQARQSLLRIADVADVVVPGHDNAFIARGL